jgi:hypothetical protein
MTTPQELACKAQWISRSVCKDLQVPALIALFNGIGGQLTCAQIIAGAQSMACIPRQDQLPALIYLALLILNNPGQNGFAGNYGGLPPPFTPNVTPAVIHAAGMTAVFAIDTSTGQIWWFYNGQWQ